MVSNDRILLQHPAYVTFCLSLNIILKPIQASAAHRSPESNQVAGPLAFHSRDKPYRSGG